MLTSLFAVVLAATAADAITEAHSGTAAQSESPLVVARADGGWTITRAIHADPAEFPFVVDERLLAGVEDGQLADDASEREALRQLELDVQLERAFEEAIDAVGAAAPPQ
jgi:hypothetical protein